MSFFFASVISLLVLGPNYLGKIIRINAHMSSGVIVNFSDTMEARKVETAKKMAI